eukprot:2762007-Prymnesium_polylepis.1
MSSASKVRQSGRRHSAALEQQVVPRKVGHVTRHNPVQLFRTGVGGERSGLQKRAFTAMAP